VFGLIGAALLIGLGVVARRPPVPLSFLSCVLLGGPVLISLMHLAQFSKLIRTEPSALPTTTSRPPPSAKSTGRVGVALKALLFGQIFMFCLFGSTMLSGSAGLGGLGIMVIAIPFALGVAVFSAWAFIRNPPSRPWAASVFVAPVILSMLLQFGVKLVGESAMTAACARVSPWLPLAVILFFPNVVGRFIPGPLRGRGACIAYVVLDGLMLLVWGLLLLFYKVSPEMGKGLILISAPLYGAISIIAGFTGLIFGYVGLFQPRKERQTGLSLMHIVLSILLLAVAVPITWFLATLMTPPG
jgi:hypothetical protein